jgi:Putative zinc-finger
MCEYSGRLIAWMDKEIAEEEAINVQWHLGQCAECREAVKAYEEISGAFLVCYEAAMPSKPRKPRVWVAAFIGAAAASLLAVVLRPPPAERLPLRPPSASHAPAIAFLRSPKTVAVAARPRRVPAPAQIWTAQEPSVRVALPADALFPPGAVPEGYSFIADVRLQP